MEFEYITYSGGRRGSYDARMRERLPEHIRGELIHGPNIIRVLVDARKTDVVEYLDKRYRIGETLDYVKQVHLEVDKREIGKYAYFYITPVGLQIDRDVFAAIVRPSCSIDSCHHGARLLQPVHIHPKKAKKVGIATIGRAWYNTLELIVSARVRALFDAEGITGLTYERCLLKETASEVSLQPALPYMANVTASTTHVADDILIKRFACEEHRLLCWYDVFNLSLPMDRIRDSDFQLVDSIDVKGQRYGYLSPALVVSQRVLKLLLKHRIRGLSIRTFFLNQKFDPIVESRIVSAPKANIAAMLAEAEEGVPVHH